MVVHHSLSSLYSVSALYSWLGVYILCTCICTCTGGSSTPDCICVRKMICHAKDDPHSQIGSPYLPVNSTPRSNLFEIYTLLSLEAGSFNVEGTCNRYKPLHSNSDNIRYTVIHPTQLNLTTCMTTWTTVKEHHTSWWLAISKTFRTQETHA